MSFFDRLKTAIVALATPGVFLVQPKERLDLLIGVGVLLFLLALMVAVMTWFKPQNLVFGESGYRRFSAQPAILMPPDKGFENGTIKAQDKIPLSMAANLNREIRKQLESYLSGESSLRQFRNWFDAETWDLDMRPDTPLGQTVGEIELRLAEFTNGHRTEDDLRATLQPLLQRETANKR